MARSTFHDQFHRLEDRGYLVHSHGNTYDFYEVPKSATQQSKVSSERGQDKEIDPPVDNANPTGGHDILAKDIEINNIPNPIDTDTNKGTISEVKGCPTQPKKVAFEF